MSLVITAAVLHTQNACTLYVCNTLCTSINTIIRITMVTGVSDWLDDHHGMQHGVLRREHNSSMCTFTMTMHNCSPVFR